ncbi:MAG TPA: hypothetical protein VLA34_07885, partial [Candidatus Krumholzibacterium sp.]|nr:hypothetical protein [Candidatus Krumholzibacterium sp.]
VRRTVDRRPASRSWSRLVNMALHARERFGAASSPAVEFRGRETEKVITGTSDRALEDVLFAFDRVETSRPMPAEAVLGGRRIDIAGLSRPDDMIELLLEREEMTRIQRDLVREAVNHTHFLLRERGMKIFHIVLPTSPDWFAGEMADILGGTIPSDWNEVVTAGRYPDISGFAGDVFNDHGGGHYTAGFNAFWARRIMDLLEANQVGGWSESTIPR